MQIGHGGDAIKRAGTNLALVRGSGVAAHFSGKLALLQLNLGGHLVTSIIVGEIEHGIVQCMEAGQRNRMEFESHCRKILLELGDIAVVKVLLTIAR